MRKGWVLGVLALCACGHGSSAADAGNVGAPANLAGDLAFTVGVGTMGSRTPGDLTLLFQERGASGCLPAGARSVALSLQTRDGSPLQPGTFTFGPSDAGASTSDGGAQNDGGATDGGAQDDAGAIVDAGPLVQVSALYSDGDAGLVDLRARSGTVVASAVDTDHADLGAKNTGSFQLVFVTQDGGSYTLNGAYDLARQCR